jgi:hypothetical protein
MNDNYPTQDAIDAANELRDRLREFIPDDRLKLYHTGSRAMVSIHAPGNGFGIPAEVWDGIRAFPTETLGMDALPEEHEHHREDSHHAVLVRVVGYTSD